MKYVIAGMIACVLVLSAGTLAVENYMGSPTPIVVIVLADTMSQAVGLDVSVSNLADGRKYTYLTKTNKYGEVNFDWNSNMDIPYLATDGDEFEVRILDKPYNAVFQGGIVGLRVDLRGECIPVVREVIKEVPVEKIIFKDCSIGDYLPEICPEIDELCTEDFLILCELTSECEICPECPKPEEEGYSIVQFVLGIVLALVGGAGVGFTVYRDKNGKVKFNYRTHRHYGRNYYHSIYRVHRSPVTHAHGELVPKYVDGKYVK